MATSTEQLNQQIKDQGDVVRRLKAEKADKSTIQPELDNLFQLKLQLAEMKGDDAGRKGKAKKAFTLKTPKVHIKRAMLQELSVENRTEPV